MRQEEIDRAVALCTRESVKEIRRRGFVMADEVVVDYDPEPAPQIVDWDQLDSQRLTLFP